VRTLAFRRRVVIERRNNENQARRGNDIVLEPMVPYEFSEQGAAFFRSTYPDDVYDLTPSPCAVAVRAAIEELRR
jgi:hypothetical protein